MTTTPRAPADLDTAGRKLWRDILRTHDLDGRELAILHEAARQADTLDALAKVLASQGYTTVGSAGQQRLNPAVTEARQGRLALGRLRQALHQLITLQKIGGETAVVKGVQKILRTRRGHD